MPIQQYLKIGKPLTKQDTINFQFKGRDTMVLLLPDLIEDREKNHVRVEYEPKDSLFLEIYKDVVYGKPNSKTRNAHAMTYWKDEIKIFFASSVPIKHAQELMKFANEISSDIDSLKISKVGDKEESNFLVYYLNREHNTDYDPRITEDTGGYFIHWNGNHQIYKASLKINTEIAEDEDLQLQLLTYHFFKSLGYFKSSDTLNCESFLSSCRSFRNITAIDKEILKYHYSYGICKGVNLDTFEEMHKDMQNTMLKHPNAKVYVIHEK